MHAQRLAPHYFIYLAPCVRVPSDGERVEPAQPARMPQPMQLELRARNYIGGWLHDENVEVTASAVARCGWSLPAFRRWVRGVVALRRKPSRDESTLLPVDCVAAPGEGFCLVMDLATFASQAPPNDK